MTLIVIRGIGGRKEGWWWDTERMEKEPTWIGLVGGSRIQLEPTGVFERRDDGATAEVWRPKRVDGGEPGGNPPHLGAA